MCNVCILSFPDVRSRSRTYSNFFSVCHKLFAGVSEQFEKLVRREL